MIRRIFLALGLALLPAFAAAQNITNLNGVTVTSPGSGQMSQPFTFNCSVSGCASGTVSPLMTIVQGNAVLSATNGAYFNLLLGNAVPSSSNTLPVTIENALIPVTGTFWQTTQPVSAASLPLPSGAATAANQEVTAAGTSASSAQGVQGVTNGVPMPTNQTQQNGVALGSPTAWGSVPGSGNVINANVNCLSGCSGSGETTDVNLSLTGTISAANNASTGLVVGNYMSTGGLTGYTSGGAELTGTATPNSAMSTSGFSGWNSIWVECSGLGTAGTNWFEIDTSGGSGGTIQKRQVAFTGPTFSGLINASAATLLNIMADQYASGTPSCTARGTQNFAARFAGNGPAPGNFSLSFTANSSTTALLVTGVAALSINITSFSEWTDGSAPAAGSAQLIAGTGPTCGTSTVNIGAVMNFPAGSGVQSPGPVGQQFTLPPGDNLCLTTTTTNAVKGNLTIVMR